MQELVAYLYDALASKYGIKLITNDPVRLSNKFYHLRKQDPDLRALSFVVSPTNPTGELWLVKRIPDAQE